LDAYELRRLWLDPPPFKEVLARRLTAAKQALKGRSARIALPNTMVLAVSDLSVFFDVVQRSVLAGPAGDLVDSLADGNIRRGLSMIASFLTSWHVQADRAVRQYLEGETDYTFPFHEVFKGAVLGQWLRFKEGRTDVLNLFDAHLGSRRVEPLRWWALQYLVARASQEHTTEVSATEVIDFVSALGASQSQALTSLRTLAEYSLIRDLEAHEISALSTVAVTRSGAYYARSLGHTMVYVEQVMMDTAIFDREAWAALSSLTDAIDRERNAGERMKLRRQRLAQFTQYLVDIEAEELTFAPSLGNLTSLRTWKDAVMAESDRAIRSASRVHNQG